MVVDFGHKFILTISAANSKSIGTDKRKKKMGSDLYQMRHEIAAQEAHEKCRKLEDKIEELEIQIEFIKSRADTLQKELAAEVKKQKEIFTKVFELADMLGMID